MHPFLVFCCCLISSLTWNRHYDFRFSDHCSALVPVEDGYVITGNTMRYLFVQKVDTLGNQVGYKEWYKAEGYDIERMSDGYIILAYKDESPRHGIWLVRTDSDFDTLWSRSYGYNNGIMAKSHSFDLTDDSGLVMVGECGTGLIVFKTDSLGDSSWVKKYFQSVSMRAGNFIEETSDQGFIVTGVCEERFFALKLDENGDSLWCKKYFEEKTGEGLCIRETSDKGFIVLARIRYGSSDSLLLIKTDSFGNALWVRKFNSMSHWTRTCYIEVLDDGYVMISGSQEGPLVRKFDESGNVLWTKTYNRNFGYFSGFEGTCIHYTSDKGFIIGTALDISPYGSDLWLVKTDSLGNTVPLESVIEPTETAVSEVHLSVLNSAVAYSLPAGERCLLKIYDVSGVLKKGEIVCGRGEMRLKEFPVGVYFAELQFMRSAEIKKVLVFP